jgi:DNA (cytosine-5)-methyltransferase 1
MIFLHEETYNQPDAEMMARPTLISLFAGAGGLDIGLEQAGFTSLVVNELQTHACETLRQNKILNSLPNGDFEKWFGSQMEQRCYGSVRDDYKKTLKTRLTSSSRPFFLKHAEILQGDIKSFSSDEILRAAGKSVGEITLIAGGPPCQPFSRAGKRETIEVEDGRLFLEFVRVVRECRPRWFLFENVKGLAQSKTTVPYLLCGSCKNLSVVPFLKRPEALDGSLRDCCPNCGSNATSIEINDVRGGSLEIILSEFRALGYKCQHRILNAADYGVPQSRERLFIVGSRDGEAFSWPDATHCERNSIDDSAKKQLAFFSDINGKLKPWRTVRDVLWQKGHPVFGRLNYETAVIWVKNVVRPHDEPVTWSLDRPSPTVGAHQGAKLAIAPEGVPPEQLIRQQWHTKGHRQGDLPPVSVVHEMLSDEDLLKLQTFPDDWYLYGTRMERAFQIGNAVPPMLAMAVGKSIIRACGQKSKETPKSAFVEAVA